VTTGLISERPDRWRERFRTLLMAPIEGPAWVPPQPTTAPAGAAPAGTGPEPTLPQPTLPAQPSPSAMEERHHHRRRGAWWNH